MQIKKTNSNAVNLIRPLTALVLLLSLSSTDTIAADRSWLSLNDGMWSEPFRWDPFGVPTPADDVHLGNVPGIEDFRVTLDQNNSIASLEIINLMRLDTDGNNLLVGGDTTMSGGAGIFGSASGLTVRGSSVFLTDDLTLTNGASVGLTDGGRIDVTETLSIDSDSSVAGSQASTIRLFNSSSPSLVNDGDLLGLFDGGLTINQVGSGRIDLDGEFGNGRVLADRTNIPRTEHSTLTVNGDELHDDFNGTMRLHAGGTINMNLSNGWTMGVGSLLRFGEDQSDLNGNEVTLASEIYVVALGGGRINSNAILTDSAEVEIRPEGQLAFHGDARVEGGEFLVTEDAELSFEGNTALEGGTFNSHSQLSSQGLVRFNGPTEWGGIVTINGIARQNGDANVTDPTTIHAGVIDMDGGGSAMWNLGSSLVINAAGLDSTISNSFDGVLNIGGGFAPKLTINLDDPAGSWTMAGEMNLSNLNFVPFSVTRVAGSHMRLTGELDVTHLVGISSPTTFDNGSVTNFNTATTSLSLHGESTVRAGATFGGLGTLVNTSNEGLTLEDGVSLDEIGLVNAGLLGIGNSPGVADVDRFENTEEGTWLVEIGGHISGTEHDLLIATDGDSLLDGLIEVDLIDAGGGLFLPEIGDQFTVLTSVGNVNGIFDNQPVSFAAGQQFDWSVIYNPHEVILELANISVPEPTAPIFAVFGIVSMLTRRSRGSVA